jgi:hypothetical protein
MSKGKAGEKKKGRYDVEEGSNKVEEEGKIGLKEKSSGGRAKSASKRKLDEENEVDNDIEMRGEKDSEKAEKKGKTPSIRRNSAKKGEHTDVPKDAKAKRSHSTKSLLPPTPDVSPTPTSSPSPTPPPPPQLRAGSLTRHKPVFSPNARLAFLVKRNEVRVVGTSSGEEVGPPLLHPSPVVSCFLNPSNSLQLLTLSSDWKVRVWDYEEFSLLKTFDIPIEKEPGEQSVHLLSADVSPIRPSELYLVCLSVPHSAKGNRSGGSGGGSDSVDPIDDDVLESSESEEEEEEGEKGQGKRRRKEEGVGRRQGEREREREYRVVYYDYVSCVQRSVVCVSGTTRPLLALSPMGHLAAISSLSRLLLIHLSHRFLVESFPSSHVIRSLSFHPSRDLLAVGDSSGRITLWHYTVHHLLLSPPSPLSPLPPSSTPTGPPAPSTSITHHVKHWHSHAVHCLAFTSGERDELVEKEKEIFCAQVGGVDVLRKDV